MVSERVRQRRTVRKILFSNHPVMPAPDHPAPATWNNDEITAAWIGHATVLINFFGTNIITDPVFSERIGINLGIATLGIKRLVEPALSFNELPRIDLILLSHAHMDHLDLPSLRKFPKDIPVVMAKNTSDIVPRFNNIQELDWGERYDVAGVTVEAFRVKHFGARYPWNKDRALGLKSGRSFNAYLISKNGKNILFGGDTAYQEYFKELAARSISVDLAIMPIGAYNPWVSVHANPEEAVEMANHRHAKTIFPIHWATFTLSAEPADEPIARLKKAVELHSPKLLIDHIGQTCRLS